MTTLNTIFSRIFLGILITVSHSVLAADPGRINGQIIVQFYSNVEPERVIIDVELASKTDVALLKLLSASLNIWLIAFDENVYNAEFVKDAFFKNPDVALVQFNHTFSERSIPDDPFFYQQWGLLNDGAGGIADADIDADLAWDITTGGVTAKGDTIVVALISEGQFYAHEDLDYFINRNEIPDNDIDDDANGYIDDYHGWNGTTQTDSVPERLHGTHVAGIAGAIGNNGLGISGVSQKLKILPVYNLTVEADAVASYAYARDMRKIYNETNGEKGAYIVATNSSFGVDFGNPDDYPIWCAMFDSLGVVGVLSVASTANTSVNVDNVYDIPTACPSEYLITVTMTDKADNLFSAAYGAKSIDLGAPGNLIYSTIIDNSYGILSGTSMSAPHVTGAIAMMYAAACPEFFDALEDNNELMLLKLKQYLLEGVDVVPDLEGVTVSNGRLNVFRAIENLTVSGFCATGFAENALGVAYPNPAQELLFINGATIIDQEVQVQVVNTLGQVVYQRTGDRSPFIFSGIPVGDLPSGYYAVSVYNPDSDLLFGSGVIIQHQ